MNQRQDRLAAAPVSQRQQQIYDESWIELASQPSTSSLSSLGDEIVTTGLRVGNSLLPQRRRRLQQSQNHMPSTYIVSHASAQAGASSQEEYDETESEEDRIMSSSTEQVTPLPRQETAVLSASSDSDDDDNDENATALGVRREATSSTFRPQPNAFSHPPSHMQRRATSSAIPPYPQASRPPMSQRSQTRASRGSVPLSSAYQADHDEALRSSLTTLLSCAHAAGLRKRESEFGNTGIQPASTQPMGMRIVQESELMDEPASGPSTANRPPLPQSQLRVPPSLKQARTASNSSAPSVPESSTSRETTTQPDVEKPTAKRASEPKSDNKSPRAAKKKRTASPVGRFSESSALISPTMLTWVVSAGVLVLVVGFGAVSFVIGREVGRQEGAAGLSSMSAGNASCAREAKDVIRHTSGGTLRRLKWGAVGRTISA